MHLCFVTILLLGIRLVNSTDDVPLLNAADVRRGKIVKTDFYEGSALYGYIDGGADLYLEYGFKKLGRQEIRAGGERMVVEIYLMRSPLDAFGVFSVMRFQCVPLDSTTPLSCQSPFQLQAAVGDCYLSITNETGSLEAQRQSVDLFRELVRKIKPQTVRLANVFSDPLLKPHAKNAMYMCGRLGLQNGMPGWEQRFRGLGGFSLTVLPIERGEHSMRVAHVRFDTKEGLQDFMRLSGFGTSVPDRKEGNEINGELRFATRLRENEVLYLECSKEFPEWRSYIRSLTQGE